METETYKRGGDEVVNVADRQAALSREIRGQLGVGEADEDDQEDAENREEYLVTQ